jgi:hypothetical protein
MAPAYTEYVNNHILMLGVAAPIVLGWMCLRRRQEEGRSLAGWLLGLGTLAGFGYTIDLGAGPILFASVAGLVCWRVRRPGMLCLFALAALPWLAAHHALNYSIGGTWKPANAVADYLDYPGSPFSTTNMTGTWKHDGPWSFLVYAAALMFGKKGFVGHNLPLFLALPGLFFLLRRRVAEAWAAGFWIAGTWLLYSAASNNFSGMCVSIRWFVPLLAPGYLLLALYLRERPDRLTVFCLLSAGGLALSAWMLVAGPWSGRMVRLLWPVQGVVLATWAHLDRRRASAPVAPTTDVEPPRVAA